MDNQEQYTYDNAFEETSGQAIDNETQQRDVVYVVQKEPGDDEATLSLILSIIGFFVPIASLVLGILGIHFCNKARAVGNRSGKATAGKVIGIIDIVYGAFIILYVIFIIIVFIFALQEVAPYGMSI